MWGLIAVPAILGKSTFFLRDLEQLFIPLRAFGMAELSAGRVPATNPSWALGQAFRGDPNGTAFLPDNLLYLWLPFFSAFNLHLTLHWLLAGLSMALLARALSQSWDAAVLAALCYAGSGWMLSVLTFYTVATIAGWLPLVLLGGVVGGRRGVALGGLALGICLLSSDPVLLLGMVPLALLTIRRHGWLHGLLTVGAIGVAGCLVGLPQLVATARIAPGTYRFGHGLPQASVGDFALHPGRLLELLVPLPFGWPHYSGEHATWATGVVPKMPLYLSLYFGVGAVLALVAASRKPWLSAVGAAGFLVAWAGGVWPGLLALVGQGGFRSPEKFVVWPAVAIPLLAGYGLDLIRSEPAARRQALTLTGVGAVGGAVAAVVVQGFGQPSFAPDTARQQLASGLVLAALLLALLAWSVWRQSAGGALAVQLLSLTQLFPLVQLAPVSELRAVDHAPAGDSVIVTDLTNPPWQPPRLSETADAPVELLVRSARLLGPTPGVLDGRTYPAAPDAHALHHQFYDLLLRLLARGSEQERLAWSAQLGCRVLVTSRALAADSRAELIGVATVDGLPSFLYGIAQPAPEVWWPRAAVAAATPFQAFAVVAAQPEPTATVVLPFPVTHHARGVANLVESDPDRLLIDVDGDGGVLVVRRAFWPMWTASADGVPLVVAPANMVQLGVVVPFGRHRVVLEISSWPERLAGVVALGVAVLLLLELRQARRAGAPGSPPGPSQTSAAG